MAKKKDSEDKPKAEKKAVKKKTAKKTTKKSESKEDKKSSKKSSKKEVIQPEISIGLVGHVDHGKTTLVKALSGKWADTHSEEMKRGITIRLGYADASFYKCKKFKGADAYSTAEIDPKWGMEKGERVMTVSLVDAPGHESLMATMLSGAAIMDAAILMISANEACPQPQTKEHIMALSIMGMKNVIIVQNKIDLVSEEEAMKNYDQIKKFISNTVFKDAPIVPISAQHNINVDFLIQTIIEKFKLPDRNDKKDPLMYVARSFDINKPGTEIKKLLGGVLGGSLKQGTIKEGDELEILPGREVEEKNKKVWKPIKTKAVGLMSGGGKLEKVSAGGSIAVLTDLDPSIVKSDALGGAVVGHPGKLPEILYDLDLEVHLLQRVVGTKDKLLIDPIKNGEVLMLNVNAAATVGIVNDLSKDHIKCSLKRPICAEKGARITISRRFGNRWRLIGYGII